jgi:hypothetical protein
MTLKTYFRRRINCLERDKGHKNIEIAIWSVAIISESTASNLTGGTIFLAGTVVSNIVDDVIPNEKQFTYR